MQSLTVYDNRLPERPHTSYRIILLISDSSAALGAHSSHGHCTSRVHRHGAGLHWQGHRRTRGSTVRPSPAPSASTGMAAWQRHLPGMMLAIQHCATSVSFFLWGSLNLNFFLYISNYTHLINVIKYVPHGFVWSVLVGTGPSTREPIIWFVRHDKSSVYNRCASLTKPKVKLWCPFYKNHDA